VDWRKTSGIEDVSRKAMGTTKALAARGNLHLFGGSSCTSPFKPKPYDSSGSYLRL